MAFWRMRRKERDNPDRPADVLAKTSAAQAPLGKGYKKCDGVRRGMEQLQAGEGRWIGVRLVEEDEE